MYGRLWFTSGGTIKNEGIRCDSREARSRTMNTDEKAISAALTKYEDALNRSDTDAVMKLYAPDGVFMPQNFPSSIGADAVRKAYEGVFRTITLSVKFAVAEIKQVGHDWKIARYCFSTTNPLRGQS